MSSQPSRPNPGPGPGVPPPQGNITLVIVALVMGFIAVVVTNLYVAQQKNKVRAQTVTVYRFNKDIDAGQSLNAARDLEAVQIPLGFEDAFLGAVRDQSEYDGDPLTQSVRAREVMVKDMFVSDGGDGPRSVPPGHAVKTIRVDRNSLSDAVRANEFVDVYASFKTEGRSTPMKVLARVKILRRGANQVDLLLTNDAVAEVMAVENFFSFDSRKGFELVGLPKEEGAADWAGTGVNPAVLSLIRFKR